MDNKILIANLKEALKELKKLNDCFESPHEYVNTVIYLVKKTIKDLEKEPYIKSYQLTAVWNDGVLEQYTVSPEMGEMFRETLKTLKEISRKNV